MLSLQKFDLRFQFSLGLIMLISIPILFIYGFMAGLLVMGVWQLISAIANTNTFLGSGHTKQIIMYWKYTGLVMALMLICFPLSLVFDADDVQVIGAVAIIGSIPLAGYYMSIYSKLIETLKLKEELSGLVKSNH